MRKYFLLFLSAVISLSCLAQTIVIKSHDANIHYMGRILMTDEAAQLSWPGTSVKINISGTGVKATLRDEYNNNFFNVIVDGKVTSIIHTDSTVKEYILAANLPAGTHSVELFKRTESGIGKIWFYQFALDKNTRILPAPAIKKRKIEFFGNSITCGMANEDTSGKDRGTGPYENNYLSYAAITARHYDAEYYCTAKSGIGVLVSWFPLIMPEMYNRTDATDSESMWDFKKYTPDLVIINLFQNDSWIIKLPDNALFKQRFGNKPPSEDNIVKAYKDFVKTVRNKYPKSQIICALGNMDATKDGSPWPGYVEKAVAQLEDKNIFTHFFAYKNTPGHPSVKEQQVMADELIAFIDRHIKW